METFFQGLLVLFAVVGLFQIFWRLLLFFLGRKTKEALRVLVKITDETDVAVLSADLERLSRFPLFFRDLRIWLICPKGAKQEAVCRRFALRSPSVRLLMPEQLDEEVKAFWEEL